MKIEKYHGLGNNFLLTEYKKGIDYKEVSRRLCNQKTSIGGDGLIVVKKEPLWYDKFKGVRFWWIIENECALLGKIMI